MKGKLLGKVGLIILVAIVLAVIDLPPQTKAPYLSWAPDYIKNQQIHLGLDLQGGSELDYKIDLRKVPIEDQQSIIDGVREVINRRVNGLGVSEPNIFVSQIAGESHIVVDLAGVDIDEAKSTIGKTIQLEFKERKDEIDPNEKQEIETRANEVLQRVKGGEDFELVGQEEEQADPTLVTYTSADWKFRDEIHDDLAAKLFAMQPGQIYEGTVETGGEYTITEAGELIELTGINIFKLIETEETERITTEERGVLVRHILVAYEGTTDGVTRTKEEAETFANELLEKINNGEDFGELAKANSDDAGSAEMNGVLGKPAGRSAYVAEFESAALALTEKDQVTDLVETEYGFHIIKADDIIEAMESTTTEKHVKYAKIFYSTIPSDWQETGLTGEHFVHADVQFNQVYQPYVSIQFNTEGADLFATITERNVGKPLAIFVGGDLISAPNVNAKINGGSAQISGNFSLEEATELARDLNTGAIPAPIILAGQYTIGASLGQDALAKSLWAGIIGLFILAVYMVLYYRLKGLFAVAALAIYAIILLFLIQSKLDTIIAVVIAVTMFVLLMIKILNSKDNGWEKLLTSILAVFALFFIVYLLANPIVLTLAGVAGVILSIGMAVDANVLIFERIKEEIRDGRPLGSAIDIGFNRAWSSIRDSNFSSLITCAILFYFGSSIIQGFAFNLAAGILVSMFTAITITKTFLKTLVGTSFAKNYFLLGAKPEKKERKPLRIIQNTKLWFTFSGVVIAICVVAVLSFGLKLGIDFTGGTLMQVKFTEEVTQEELKEALEEIGADISGKNDDSEMEAGIIQTAQAQELEATMETATTQTELIPAVEEIDLSSAQIIWSNDGFIIKTKYMSNETHDEILSQLTEKFGELEEPRFTTVGPTVGETMKYKATIALIIALVVIVLYIAFAFRKIPRNVSPWRFGISAIIALTHDILFVVGIYAILGVVMGVEIDALFITALLTILGFSVHDTIVVFDRVRENLKNMGRDATFADVANKALNQTMARSMNTSISTLFTLLALLLLGSISIFYFVLALVLGTIVGTYSSIFIASPVLVWWNTRAQKRKER
ncbi:protein translocase subunit SecF [Patescibacteria group bacterium]